MSNASTTTLGENLRRRSMRLMAPVDEQMERLSLARKLFEYFLDHAEPTYQPAEKSAVNPAPCLSMAFTDELCELLKDVSEPDRNCLMVDIKKCIENALVEEHDIQTWDFKSISFKPTNDHLTLVFNEAHDAKAVLKELQTVSSRLLIDNELFKRFDPSQAAQRECVGRG